MLNNAETSLQLQEKEQLKNKVVVGVLSGLGGILLGGMTAFLITINSK